jgi:uncharacterized protein (TIGR03067 family)
MPACKRAVWVVAVLVVAGNASPADDDKKEVKKEMEKLAGVWLPVTVESGGMKADGTDDALKGLQYVFTADGKFRLEKDGEVQMEGTYTLDPSKKPKQIDYKIEKAKSDTFKGTTSLGIYELDGDTFKVCRTWPDNDTRPTEYSGAKDAKQILSEFKREKKK